MTHTRRHSPPLRFPQFHDNWTETKLADVAEIVKGKGLSKADIGSHGRECILYGELYTIYNTEVIHTVHSRTLSIPQGAVQSVSNDVLIPSSGESAEDIAVARYLPYSGILLGGDLNIIRLYKDSGLFLAYELNGIRRKDISQIAQGSSVVHLYAKTLANLSLSLPGLAEQEKIAGFLSLIDQRISSQSKIIDGLNDLKRGLSNRLFSQSLRFPQFHDNWTQTKLGDVAEKRRMKNIDLKISKVYSNSAQQGIIEQTDFFDKEIANKNNLAGYYIIEFSDFVYNPRISKLAPVGAMNLNNQEEIGLVSPLYTVFKLTKNDINQLFLSYLFTTEVWHGYMKSIANYGARDDRMNIKDGDFFALPLSLPTLAEQEKIAGLLSSIDKRIALEEELLKQYQLQKSYLLKQMFV